MFRDLTLRALWPAIIDDDAPVGIAADWLDDHGECGAAEVLRLLATEDK